MAPGWTTEYSIFVLQAHHVDVIEIQKGSCFLIRPHVVLGERPPYWRRIVVSSVDVIYRKGQQPGRAKLRGNGAAQVGSERSDSAMPRQIIPNYCDPARQGCLGLRSGA